MLLSIQNIPLLVSERKEARQRFFLTEGGGRLEARCKVTILWSELV